VSETGFTFVFEPDSASVSGLDSDITQTTHKHVKGRCLSMPQRPGRSAAELALKICIFDVINDFFCVMVGRGNVFFQ